MTPSLRALPWLACFVTAACSSSSPTATGTQPDDSAGGTTDGGSTTLPACSMSFPPADAAGVTCTVSRTYLSCVTEAGAGENCHSDNATSCPSGDSSLTCTNECKADEYAVSCGSVEPGAAPATPTGCRALLAGPGGGVSVCCPCGS